MKKLLLFVFSLFSAFSQTFTLSAQTCMADAGEDYHWCRTMPIGSTPPRDSIVILGGKPTASGGIPPYTYEWSMDSIPAVVGNSFYYASYYLDDTTSANPRLLSPSSHDLTFYLRVEDAKGDVCYDTVTVTSSGFAHHLAHYVFNIQKGDSIQISGPNVWSSFGLPASVLWRPNHGLIDSTAFAPWVRPEKDIVYYCVVWDSAGCEQEGHPFQEVNVFNIGIDENDLDKPFKIYPTILKSGENLFVEKPAKYKQYTLFLYDIQGKIILEKTTGDAIREFYTGNLASGIYLYKIFANAILVKQGKTLIQ